MILNFKKIIILLALFIVTTFAVPVFAAETVFDGIDCIMDGNCTLCDAVHTIINITDMIIGFSGIIAIVMIIFGGALMLTAWGQEPRVAMGKKTIIAALVGIFIVFIAWTVINTIIVGTVGSTDGGYSKVVEIVGGGSDWSKCPGKAGAPASGSGLDLDLPTEINPRAGSNPTIPELQLDLPPEFDTGESNPSIPELELNLPSEF